MKVENLQIIKFPAGEVQVRLPHYRYKTIFAKIKDNDALMATYQALEILAQDKASIDLVVPYLPYSRQDRNHTAGECASLHTMLNLLRLRDSGRVNIHTLDIHNPHQLPIRNVKNYKPWCWLPLRKMLGAVLVYPDVTAAVRYKPIKTLLDRFVEIPHTVCAFEKKRDPISGKLSDILPVGEIPADNNHYVLIDDICDGGGTFVPIAEQIRKVNNYARIDLVTSHSMYSRGFDHLLLQFDKLYTTDSWFTVGPGLPERVSVEPIFPVFASLLEIDGAYGIGL